jgi:hypothetical protein
LSFLTKWQPQFFNPILIRPLRFVYNMKSRGIAFHCGQSCQSREKGLSYFNGTHRRLKRHFSFCRCHASHGMRGHSDPVALFPSCAEPYTVLTTLHQLPCYRASDNMRA